MNIVLKPQKSIEAERSQLEGDLDSVMFSPKNTKRFSKEESIRVVRLFEKLIKIDQRLKKHGKNN